MKTALVYTVFAVLTVATAGMTIPFYLGWKLMEKIDE